MYLYQSEGGLGVPGCYVGDDLYAGDGAAWAYDPWNLYNRADHGTPRVLSSLDRVVYGLKGFGKSTDSKVYVYRQVSNFGRSAFVVSPKPDPTTGASEWTAVTDACNGSNLALRPGGSVILNPLAMISSGGERTGRRRAGAGRTRTSRSLFSRRRPGSRCGPGR